MAKTEIQEVDVMTAEEEVVHTESAGSMVVATVTAVVTDPGPDARTDLINLYKIQS